MMQPTKDGCGPNGIGFSATMSRTRLRDGLRGGRRIGNPGTQRHVRAPAIVVGDPGFQDETQMGFRQWDQPVQTFPADRADHAFTNGIHLWTVRRGLQHPDPEGPDRLVELACEDTVAIVNQELVPSFVADHLTQLLQRPGSARMGGDVAVDQSTAAMLDYHKHIQHTKCRGDGAEEITGYDSLSVQAQESRPAQIASRPTSRTPGQVLAHRPGRHPNPDLQEQLIGDAFLAPRVILTRDPANQRL